MAAVNYMDFITRLGPNDKIARLIEMQKKTNRILDDLVTVECNMVEGHKTTIRNGLPEVAWRMLNYGVPASKSQVTTVTDTTGMLEAWASVDVDLVKLNSNKDEFRLSENRAFLESMNQEQARTLFYGNQKVEPVKYTGLAPRYGASSDDESLAGFNVVKASAGANPAHDYTSIWLACWGENTLHAIHPKGTEAGFHMKDWGEQIVRDELGNEYVALKTHYKWDQGLCLRDWRYVVRIANIDLDDIDKAGTTVDLLDALTDAYYRVPDFDMGTPVLYANKKVLSWLHKQVNEKSKYQLNSTNVAGKPVLDFMGIPFKKCDAIGVESAVA